MLRRLFVAALVAAVQFIDHDKVKPFAESASPLELAFKPQLVIGDHSCHPFAAVDADGNIGGGLKPAGGPSSNCREADRAQVYVRTMPIHVSGLDMYALMYAWYFVCRHSLTHPNASRSGIWHAEARADD